MIDTVTGLEWMHCELGQLWRNKTCHWKAKSYSRQQVLGVSNGYSYAGYTDWRVPTIHELNTLVYCSNGKSLQYDQNGIATGDVRCGRNASPMINNSIFPNASSIVWSSSLNEKGLISHWHTRLGWVGLIILNEQPVRLVRSVQ